MDLRTSYFRSVPDMQENRIARGQITNLFNSVHMRWTARPSRNGPLLAHCLALQPLEYSKQNDMPAQDAAAHKSESMEISTRAATLLCWLPSPLAKIYPSWQQHLPARELTGKNLPLIGSRVYWYGIISS